MMSPCTLGQKSKPSLSSYSSLGALAAIAAVSFALTACGSKAGNKLVQHAEFTTTEEAGVMVGHLGLVLDTGGLAFPSVNLPIYNPRDKADQLGLLTVQDSAGTTSVDLKVNLVRMTQVPGLGDNSLPNGKPLPVGGVDSKSIFSFPIGAGASRAYVGFSAGKLNLAGVAVAITQFDGVKFPFDLFLPFAIKNGLSGTAGVFTPAGDLPGGIGVFAATTATVSTGEAKAASAEKFQKPSFPEPKVSDKDRLKVRDSVQAIANRGQTLILE